MFTSLRIHMVFKRATKEQKPPRARSGQGAASVIPFMKADQDSRFAESAEGWSVLTSPDEREAGASAGS